MAGAFLVGALNGCDNGINEDGSNKESHFDKLNAKAQEFLYTKVGYNNYKTPESNPPETFDCSSFAEYVYKQALDIDIPKVGDYQTVNRSQRQFNGCDDVTNPKPGDLVFFSYTLEEDNIGHVGIYLGGTSFIGAHQSTGVSIVEFSEGSYWGQFFVGYKRVPEFKPQ